MLANGRISARSDEQVERQRAQAHEHDRPRVDGRGHQEVHVAALVDRLHGDDEPHREHSRNTAIEAPVTPISK
jgi:hypothetical protein